MKIALAQINSYLGDFERNRKKILSMAEESKRAGCDLMITPELSLFGYTSSDFMEYSEIVKEQLKNLTLLEKQICKDFGLVVGALTFNKRKGKPYHNSALFLESGKKARIFSKHLLPSYDVFDEGRYVEPGIQGFSFFKWKGKKIALSVCEDIWAWEKRGFSPYSKNPLERVRGKKGDRQKKRRDFSLDLFINISASPFAEGKQRDRHFMAQKTATFFQAPVVFVNRVGGEDELIFDGRSFVLNKEGKRIFQCEEFKEDLGVFNLESLKGLSTRSWVRRKEERLWKALVLGLSDFVRKSGLKKVHFGLSGGVDSALVACLASEALGSKNVTALALPSAFNPPESLELAKELASTLKVHWRELGIEKVYQMCRSEIETSFGNWPFGLVDENLQSRLRNLFLMAFANKERSLLLNTSNKSELAMGYGTLYGDLSGALCVIGDLLKSEVFELARFFNEKQRKKGLFGIPLKTLSRPPSAELKPGQTDEKELELSYHLLDKKIEKLILQKKLLKGKDQKWYQRLMASEFKRWQAPPILKLSKRAFGKGRRFPT